MLYRIKPIYFFLHLFFCVCISAYAQQITVDDSQTPQQLIQNTLVEGCVDITNVTSTINGSQSGFSSFGYFEAGTSNFPFQNGIILSTGNANSAGTPVNTATLNEGGTDWGTDPDLETALGLSNTLNATSIEFDFISISSEVQFNYILASEEYFEFNPCNYSDGFAFLIKETGSSSPYQNLAVIPGTSTPVNTTTIHDQIAGPQGCPAENSEYFFGYNVGDTNFNGRTTVLSATASVTPYTQYHIKLIIADQTDQFFDSAVFIEGNSFAPIFDLGEDITTCASQITLNGDIDNPQANYVWLLDDTPITGEISPTLSVTESGTYTVEITIPLNETNCVIEDSIVIELSSEQTADPIPDYILCDDASEDGLEIFDLNSKNDDVLAAVPGGNYSISYHASQANAQNNNNPITSPIQNDGNPQTIYVRIEDIDNGCLAFATFNLVVGELPSITAPTPLEVCDDDIADGYTAINLTVKNEEITGNESTNNVTYHYTQEDAETGENSIASPYTNTITPSETLYVRVEDPDTSCFNTTTLTITVLQTPVIDTSNHYIDACDPEHDGFAAFDLTTIIDEIIDGLTGVSTSFYTSYDDAETGSNPIANETDYENVDQNVQVLYIRVVDDVTGCVSITEVEIHTNLLLTGTQIQDFSLCDDEGGDGIEEFDLESIADFIAYDVPDVSISFYETQEDLDNGTNPLNINQLYEVNIEQTLYIQLDDGNCTEVAEITLEVFPYLGDLPIAPIDYCDTDDDGLTTVDMQVIDDIITASYPGVSVTFHPTESDAQDNLNPLPDSYENQSNPETIYVRFANTTNGCSSTSSFVLNIIPAPATSQPEDILICDNDQDGFSTINLNNIIPDITPTTTNLILNFFTELSDAETNTNPITNTSNFPTYSQTLYCRVESNITGCYNIVTFDVIISTLPEFTEISNYQLCEDDNDMVTDFFLNEKDEEILNAQTDKDVLYFETQTDAVNRTNSIDKFSAYQNISSPQTIYVRVENVDNIDCFGTSFFTLEVAPNPVYNEPEDWLICDDSDNDGIASFDLNEKLIEISLNSTDELTITFHETYQTAQMDIAALPLEYTNINNPQLIYVRIENQFGCSIISDFQTSIISSPEVGDSEPMVLCDEDYDGITSFNLLDAEYEILEVRPEDLEITYFENIEDADTNTNPITNPEAYSNLTNPQTVYIKVTNIITDCFNIIPLDLIVNLPPEYNPVSEVSICDTPSGTYNLNLVTPLLINNPESIDPVTVSYYSSMSDAETATNPLNNIFEYTASSHIIYVRIENPTTGCFLTTQFTLIINPTPQANTPNDLVVCDIDNDGSASFDLNQQDSTVLGNQNPNIFTVNYFDSLANAMSGNNPLESPYIAFNGQTIYVRVEGSSTGCVGLAEFITIVNPTPEIDIPDQVTLCTDNMPLTISADTGIPSDTYLWSTGETTSEINLYEEDLGQHWVTVTNEVGCISTKNFTVIPSESATIEFTSTVDFSDPNSITVNITGSGSYAYSLDNGPLQSSNVFNDVSPGVHMVTVVDLNGCLEVSQEVLVFDYPKFFTPNNDTYNDTWHIIGIEQLPGTIVHIFDRYGKLLTTLSANSEGWDGNYNGTPMPTNDYWFLAKIRQDSESFDVKGHFTLKR